MTGPRLAVASDMVTAYSLTIRKSPRSPLARSIQVDLGHQVGSGALGGRFALGTSWSSTGMVASSDDPQPISGVRRALPPEVGDLLDGRFLLMRRAATGGMGVVFEAVDTSTDARVAVKVMTEERASDCARFEREAQVLASLRHPGIVTYVAHRMTAANAYLAMEWLDGEDLAARLGRGRVPLRHAVVLGTRVAGALGAIHARGVVHRDVKPGNLFLVGRDATKPKILDLGLARVDALPGLTRVGTLVGTLGYVAPEQAGGGRLLDARADVFSLGCVLFKCITGTPVFSAANMLDMITKILHEEAPALRTRCPEVPAALDALMARMLAKDPARRPRDGREVAAELSAIAV